MPVEFLTDEQRNRYGRFMGEPPPEALARSFHLDDTDREIVARHRGEHNRLGFAVQLCTVRFLGTFLENLTEVPSGVLAILARQLHIAHADCFTEYTTGQTRWEHTTEIRQLYGYRDFSDEVAQFRLNRWLYALCWTGTDRPGVLFDRATVWLLTHKVLLPGVTVLERHVVHLRTRVHERVWRQLSRELSPAAKTQLETLLTVPAGGHLSPLERLRNGPFRRSAPELIRALRRVEDVRTLQLPRRAPCMPLPLAVWLHLTRPIDVPLLKVVRQYVADTVKMKGKNAELERGVDSLPAQECQLLLASTSLTATTDVGLLSFQVWLPSVDERISNRSALCCFFEQNQWAPLYSPLWMKADSTSQYSWAPAQVRRENLYVLQDLAHNKLARKAHDTEADDSVNVDATCLLSSACVPWIADPALISNQDATFPFWANRRKTSREWTHGENPGGARNWIPA